MRDSDVFSLSNWKKKEKEVSEFELDSECERL